MKISFKTAQRFKPSSRAFYVHKIPANIYCTGKKTGPWSVAAVIRKDITANAVVDVFFSGKKNFPGKLIHTGKTDEKMIVKNKNITVVTINLILNADPGHEVLHSHINAPGENRPGKRGNRSRHHFSDVASGVNMGSIIKRGIKLIEMDVIKCGYRAQLKPVQASFTVNRPFKVNGKAIFFLDINGFRKNPIKQFSRNSSVIRPGPSRNKLSLFAENILLSGNITAHQFFTQAAY